MTSDARALTVIATISVVTIALRAIPFLAVDRLSASPYLRFLGEKMPVGVMILLVAYTLKDLEIDRAPYGLPDLGALALSVALYWWTRNSLLSIGLALAAYLVVVNCLI